VCASVRGLRTKSRLSTAAYTNESAVAENREKSATVPGFRVGHASDFRGLTGCTVVLCEAGAVCGVNIGGSATGTRDLTVCRPEHLVEKIHAVFLTGGSAFGLDAAQGVMAYLERRGVGFAVGKHRVPIVPGAVIFDLNLGSGKARPDAGMALWACRNAKPEVAEGSVGAGTGATVGKLFGIAASTKGGVGFASVALPRGAAVQALAVVNAFGDVLEPRTGRIIAGARTGPESCEFADTASQMLLGKTTRNLAANHTTLAVVMTNAGLTKLQAAELARMAQDGLARAIRPVHTRFDGDLVFALSLGSKRFDLNALGEAAAEAVAEAVVRGVELATELGGVPAASGLKARQEEKSQRDGSPR
jgi:L-aminopeptidase/D-esterase-like protein